MSVLPLSIQVSIYKIHNPAQMSSLRSGVYNITGKNKVGTRIVYNIFWLDEPVQVSINSNTEFCPNVLCPFRCLYIDIPFLGKMRFWPKISRKIDALTGVSLPQLRLRFVGKICYANQKMRCYASQRIQRVTHVRILNSFVAICEVKSPCLITLLWMGSRGYMMIDRVQIEKSFGKVFGCYTLGILWNGDAKKSVHICGDLCNRFCHESTKVCEQLRNVFWPKGWCLGEGMRCFLRANRWIKWWHLFASSVCILSRGKVRIVDANCTLFWD